jgi:hypothetical protein
METNLNYSNMPVSDPGDMTAGRKAQDFLRDRLAKRDSRKPEAPVADPTHNFQAPGMPPAYQEQSPSRAGGDNNFNTALKYGAMNEAQFKHSQQNFNAQDRAQQAIDRAEDETNSMNMFKGLRQATIDMSDYYQQRSRERTLNIFGDVWNTAGGPEWKSPEDPKEIEVDFDKYDVDFD